MTTAILDTNVPVQSLIGSPHAASARVIDAYFDGRFRLCYSPDTLDELLAVLTVPYIRDRHGLTDDEILDFVAALLPYGERFEGTDPVPADIAGDATDAKFLSLAVESRADFLVTNDRRHLLPLKSHGPTRIVTPADFLRRLG